MSSSGGERDAPAGPWVVVGADGQFGTALTTRTAAAGHPVVPTTRRHGADGCLHLDLTGDPAAWVLPERVAVGLLCAAVTAWDKCRDDPRGSRLVNVERTVRLAALLAERGAHVVFPSTNQVFDGTRPTRDEDDSPSPQTEYGRQKAAAEAELRGLGAVTTVRFGKVLGPAPGWLRAWGEALLRGEAVEPFADMTIAPVPMDFAAAAMIRAGERRPGGVLQVSGEHDVSYAEIAARLADHLGADPALVRPRAFAAAGLPPGVAPPHTTLSVARLRTELGLTPPPVWDTIDSLIRGTFRGR